MSERMSRQEWSFLLEGTRTAKLATTRRDGQPHVVPVWFTLDGDDVIFATGADSVKGRALRRDGRASLCVDDERPPYAFVAIEGHATITTDRDDLLHWATRIGGRYMGEDKAESLRQAQRRRGRAARSDQSQASAGAQKDRRLTGELSVAGRGGKR